MRELGVGGKFKCYSSDNVMNPPGKREGNSPRFPKEGGKDVQHLQLERGA